MLDHLIITRFCVRIRERLADVEGPSFFRPMDPLAPLNVGLRKHLMQIASLPSVQAQTPDVAWVVIIDAALPNRDRAWLEATLAPLPRAHVHLLAPQDDLRDLDWLAPYIAPGASQVITSNLDDDDALPASWAAHVQATVRARAALPEVMVLATHDVLEWDLTPHLAAPFGYVKPWHRGRFPSSCGFSLLSSVAANACVMGLRHRFGAAVMDTSSPADAAAVNANVAYYRERFAPTLARWPKEELFYDFGGAVGPVLMSNHHVNDQATRLHEAADLRRRVRGREDLGGAPVDFSAYLRAVPSLSRGNPRRLVTRAVERLLG